MLKMTRAEDDVEDDEVEDDDDDDEDDDGGDDDDGDDDDDDVEEEEDEDDEDENAEDEVEDDKVEDDDVEEDDDEDDDVAEDEVEDDVAENEAEVDDVEDDEVKGEEDDDAEKADVEEAYTMMMLRSMMLRRKDPRTGTHTLCDPAQSKCTWATWYGNVQETCPGPEARCRLCASLRRRNALGHLKRATLCWNLQVRKFTGKMPEPRIMTQTLCDCAVEMHLDIAQACTNFTSRDIYRKTEPTTASHAQSNFTWT